MARRCSSRRSRRTGCWWWAPSTRSRAAWSTSSTACRAADRLGNEKPRCSSAARRRATPGLWLQDLLLGFGLGRVAVGLGHLEEALALAGVLSLAGVVGALTRRLTLAGVDPR